MPPRARISFGASGARKLVMFVLSLVFIVLAGASALIGYGFAYGSREVISDTVGGGFYHRDAEGKLVPGPSNPGEIDSIGMVGGIAGGVIGLVLLILAIYLLMRSLRQGAWLSGSVLNIRRAGGKRSVDLAKARLALGDNLVAVDPQRGTKLTLPMQVKRGPLPGEQLMMLANAISNSRVRNGDDDEGFKVADRLREKARDPFS